MMEICKECVHSRVCMYRAVMLVADYNPPRPITECDGYMPKAEKVDIYKMADRITETVKQVVLANLRSFCDEEGD